MSAIYVDAPDKSSGKRVQHIHIKYDGLGVIRLNELMKKETAWPKSRRPLKTQGFHHFLILLLYDQPACALFLRQVQRKKDAVSICW